MTIFSHKHIIIATYFDPSSLPIRTIEDKVMASVENQNSCKSMNLRKAILTHRCVNTSKLCENTSPYQSGICKAIVIVLKLV